MYGHASTCTTNAVRAYFANGTLPAPSTTCAPDMSTFEYMVASLTASGEGASAGNGTEGGNSTAPSAPEQVQVSMTSKLAAPVLVAALTAAVWPVLTILEAQC
jgi:hypothetical protein